MEIRDRDAPIYDPEPIDGVEDLKIEICDIGRQKYISGTDLNICNLIDDPITLKQVETFEKLESYKETRGQLLGMMQDHINVLTTRLEQAEERIKMLNGIIFKIHTILPSSLEYIKGSK